MAKKFKYQVEYEASENLFWETKPGKFVHLLSEILNNNLDGKVVLDLGAGEGKNAVYLSSLGAKVDAIEISQIAIEKINYQPLYDKFKQNISLKIRDIRHLDYKANSYDIIIAYGVLHALDSREEVYTMVKKIKTWLKSGGYFIGVTFTNKIGVPIIQNYLDEKSFLNEGELKELFTEWGTLYFEDDIITESHPTSKIIHQHSLSRILTRKP